MTKEVLISVDEFLSKRPTKAAGDKIVIASKAPASWNKDARSARFTMSTKAEDRDGDIIFTDGIDTSEFQKNPVALLFHKSRDFPIGTWADLAKSAERLEGTLKFVPEGVLDEADKAARLIEAGVLKACSIGFIPKTIMRREMADGKPVYGYEIRESELVECSVVPVPAHPDALIKEARGDMVLAKELLEEILDTYSRTPDGLIVPRKEYEAAYRTINVGAKKDLVLLDRAEFDDLRAKAAKAPAEDTKPSPEEVDAALKTIEKAGGVVPVFKAIEAKPTPPVEGEKVEEKSISERIAAVLKGLLGGSEKEEEKPAEPVDPNIVAMAKARANAARSKAGAAKAL